MPRLLIIGSSLNYGSPGRICEQLGLLARSRGWDVFMAHGLKYARPSRLKTISVSGHLEEKMHGAISLLFDAHGLGSYFGTKRLVRQIERIAPDVIHLHNLHGYYLNYEILFGYLATLDIPIVWTFHDFWPITGHCVHFDFIGCDKWKSGCFACPQKKAYPMSLLISRAERNYRLKRRLFSSIKNLTVVPVSNWVGTVVRDSFLGACPIRVIRNGVDVDVFRPVASDLRRKLGIDRKFVLLGVASPWYALKGYDDYLKLVRRLPSDCIIVMIGLSQEQISRLPRGIVGLKRTDSVQELAAYYSMADVVLNLSYQETFGMTTVEGMACGTPGIVYDKTASPELVTSDTGRIVGAGDIDQLSKAVLELKSIGKQAFENACRERAVRYFNKNDRYREYIDLYNEVVS